MKVLFLFLKNKIILFYLFLEIKVYKGPIDISCISFKPPKQIREELIIILNSNKVLTKNFNVRVLFNLNFKNFYRIVCERNGVKFEVEINKVLESDNCHVLKFKKLEGSSTTLRDICKSVLLKIKLF